MSNPTTNRDTPNAPGEGPTDAGSSEPGNASSADGELSPNRLSDSAPKVATSSEEVIAQSRGGEIESGSPSDSTGTDPGSSPTGASSEASSGASSGASRRRRGSRGGRGRKPRPASPEGDIDSTGESDRTAKPAARLGSDENNDRTSQASTPRRGSNETKSAGGSGDSATTSAKPKIGDSRPAMAPRPLPAKAELPKPVTMEIVGDETAGSAQAKLVEDTAFQDESQVDDFEDSDQDDDRKGSRRRRNPRGPRSKRAVGRFVMVVHGRPHATQVAILEGRSLVRHHVATLTDSDTQIDGNIYLGRVQNVLPGMEAAFIDIGTPKNAVLYQGDLRSERVASEIEDADDDDAKSKARTRRDSRSGRSSLRIEQALRVKQMVLCQVTKNPIGAKGARLTQEVSLPGRFVVLVPGNDAYGISKRLPDDERRRLRQILDKVRPPGYGLIVRTAAEGASEEELRHDLTMLIGMWKKIDELAKNTNEPALLYKEPNMALRMIREEFNRDFRAIYIDDRELWEKVYNYVGSISPDLVDRVQFYDVEEEKLPVFERFHVHEQLHRALDRKVWLSSGGSLVIDTAEALTVIDVNTGKNVGTSNLEETVFRTNMEAAEEVARQLQLRDIGGIIVIDFIDMEIKANRDAVMRTVREALNRDKTRTQAFDMSELCLVEMTRKRVSEGLVQSLSSVCPHCSGRGLILDESLL